MKIFLILIVAFHFTIYSQINSDPKEIFYDYCPFECCQFGKWIIQENINVYPDEADTGTVSFRLNNNDTIYAETGNLHFIQTGKVIVLKPIYGFEVNDTLSVYNCLEGSFFVKYNSQDYFVDIFWPVFYNQEDDKEENYLKKTEKREYSGKMIQRPQSVWWVKIKSEKGEGWIRLKNKTPYCFSLEENISGIDGCE